MNLCNHKVLKIAGDSVPLNIDLQRSDDYNADNCTVKKGLRVSRPQPGYHYQTLPVRNNDVITELFLPRGSLVSDIPAGDGKLVNLFLRCGFQTITPSLPFKVQ
jgi:hypothetical protein